MKRRISQFLIKRGFKRLVRRIRQLNDQDLNADQTIEFLFSKEAELIQPWQFRNEILQLAKEIEALQPKVAVEIGTANGGTLFTSSRLASKDALIVSIDLPGGNFGGGYPSWKEPIYKSFARKNQKIELIRANSHANSTIDRLKEVLKGRAIDYLFIDGDHTYEGVKHDFHLYKYLVRKGGKIAFHDVVVHPNSSCDVYKFWNEVKTKYSNKEFVNDWNQKMFGIGIIDYS